MYKRDRMSPYWAFLMGLLVMVIIILAFFLIARSSTTVANFYQSLICSNLAV